ncbi:MAG: amidophosphoribosyltransferase [Sphaerospermopsis sp. SIO1G2]|nr:amidophosphoribosyltransferase [Sphaerospermopsis sp. SIO1G2]
MAHDCDDGFHEECGVFGIYGHKDAAAHVALGLHALQHRGQEAAGIVSSDASGQFYSRRALGLVGDTFNRQSVIEKLQGNAAIGHNRYSTSGEPMFRNVQPLYAEYHFGGVALAHNGNLTNAYSLRHRLKARGCLFQSTSDTEVIIHLIAISEKDTIAERLVDGLSHIDGAYSLVVLSKDSLIGVRDPHGVRPLVLGKLEGAYVLASETCAFDIIGATYVRDIEPGEMVVITEEGLHSSHPFAPEPKKFCIFEYVYFARPDSMIEGLNTYEIRKAIGQELAIEQPVEADVVIPVPDSGVPAALGYAEQTGYAFDLGIIRNHYVGRTFIEPTDKIRNLGVKLKHNANQASIKGKRVILVDDSIVRGTTSRKIVSMVRAAGAKEVHMRIASPPSTHSCYYGVDTPQTEELLASRMDVQAMAEYIQADSLAFLSIDGLYRAVGEAKRHADEPQYCDACFTGDYAIALTDHHAQKDGSAAPYIAAISEAG